MLEGAHVRRIRRLARSRKDEKDREAGIAGKEERGREIDRIFRAIGAAYRQPISAPHSNNRLVRVTTCRWGYPPAAPRTKQRPINATRKTHTDIHAHKHNVYTRSLSLLQFSRWTFSLNARNAHSITGDSWHRHRYPDRVLFLVSFLPSPLPSPPRHTLSMKRSLLGHGYIDISTSSFYSVSLSRFFFLFFSPPITT